MKIELEFHNKRYFKVKNSEFLYKLFKSKFTLKDKTFEEVIPIDENYFYFSKFLIKYLVKSLNNHEFIISSEYNYNSPAGEGLKFLPLAAVEALAPSGITLRPAQKEFMELILNSSSGIIQLPTGFGKNTMMIYLLQVLQNSSNNILIMSPISSISDEIILRGSQYGVQICKDFSTKICCIIPQGYLNSNNVFDKNIESWLKNVNTVLIDECQEITASMEYIFENKLPNLRSCYGFSATADKFNGLDLTNLHNLYDINYDTYRILKYVGPAICYKSPEKFIKILVTSLHFGNYKNLYSYQRCINQIMSQTIFVDYLIACSDYNKGPLLIPIVNKSHTDYCMKFLPKRIKTVVWTSEGIFSNSGKKITVNQLESMKYLINNNKIDIIFSTSVGFKGVDFTGLKGVLFTSGSSYGMVTQILGRTFRFDGIPNVFLPKNLDDNPLWNVSFRKRFELLKSNNHEVVKFTFNIDNTAYGV